MVKQEQLFMTGENAIAAYAQSITAADVEMSVPRGRAVAFSAERTFVGHDTNISVKSDYARKDYNYFRPTKRIPTDLKGIINMSMDSYYKVGIVRNIIDLMTDFACQGIRFQHPRKSTENFYNKWFMDKVAGKKISAQFLTMLLKAGNVIVKKSNGFVPVIDENEWKQAISQDVDLDRIQFTKREIPLRYTFLNPIALDVVGDELANFVGQPTLMMQIPLSIRNTINRASLITDPAKKTAIDKMLSTIPRDMLRLLRSGANAVPLDMNKISVFHYRKDDWLPWAYL
jgi:hypothetical protein